MTSSAWPYVTPGIPDHLFERLPGIPLSKKEVRLVILSSLRLFPQALVWDIGAGTGTISVEAGLLCPQGSVVAVERDEEVASLIRRNCDRFQVSNAHVVQACAPDCLGQLPGPPQRICLGGGRPIGPLLEALWDYLQPGGRLVTTATSLENLYAVSAALAQVQARQVEVVQLGINRLENQGGQQVFNALAPAFILSGEKMD